LSPRGKPPWGKKIYDPKLATQACKEALNVVGKELLSPMDNPSSYSRRKLWNKPLITKMMKNFGQKENARCKMCLSNFPQSKEGWQERLEKEFKRLLT